MSHNELGSLTSPYLLQHADNPVHWKAWGDAAFEDAKKQDKPILLSIGYAACHWCHVMAHESFEDEATADLMNDQYINIKVDREEHPDVDAIYQKALSLIGQQGGWPLTMFLTPSGQPFWGGTYFPNKPAYGRPSFTQVLNYVADIYHNKKGDVTQNVTAISDALSDEAKPKGDGSLTLDHITKASQFIHQNLDTVEGGLRGAPKFPQPVLFDFLWRAAWIKKDHSLQNLIRLTLDKMCLGGIYDHVGGGFSRYSTDDEWLAPHFEKMLYDNGLLVSLLTMVWRKFPSPLYKRTVEETINWVLAEMKVDTPDGFALASALDADSEGVEGKFYVWDETEIDEILGDDAPAFKQAYDVTKYGNWERKNILRRITEFENKTLEDKLSANRTTLYKERLKRIPPQRDGKVLTDWNTMMIKGMVEAGLVFEREDWIATAKEIYNNLIAVMTKDGQLYHNWCEGQHGSLAYVEDYANLCHAALALFEATGDETYLNQVEDWVTHLDQVFWDKELGGYNFASEKSVDGLEVRQKPIYDNATPSGNGLMANVLCDLYHLTGKTAYKDQFEIMIKSFGNSNPNEIFATPGLSNAVLRHEKMEMIVMISDMAVSYKTSIKNKVLQHNSPMRKLLLGDKNHSFDGLHPLAGKKMIENSPTAYVCQVGSCSPPLTTEVDLEETLASLSS